MLTSHAVLCLSACSTDLLALPTCDPDKTFAVQIGHEETMVNGPVAYVQCALLHTSSNGERRIRWAAWLGSWAVHCGACGAAGFRRSTLSGRWQPQLNGAAEPVVQCVRRSLRRCAGV